MSKPATLSRLGSTPAIATRAAVVVDEALATGFLSACEHGDIDGCHVALVQLQQRYPQSLLENATARERSFYQPLYDLVGHGFTIAATRGHVTTLEFLISSHFALVLRDGICGDATWFPPFPVLHTHELVCCVDSIRLVCFAALACIDQLAMPAIQFLIETQTLWDHEASLCLALAMRRALVAATTSQQTQTNVSPAAFHGIIALLVQHYGFLVDAIRTFHHEFQSPPLDTRTVDIDRVRALQASLLYEIVLSGY